MLTDEETSIFLGHIHENNVKNTTNPNPDIKLSGRTLPVWLLIFSNLCSFYLLLLPYHGVLLLPPSMGKTSVVYLLQPRETHLIAIAFDVSQ